MKRMLIHYYCDNSPTAKMIVRTEYSLHVCVGNCKSLGVLSRHETKYQMPNTILIIPIYLLHNKMIFVGPGLNKCPDNKVLWANMGPTWVLSAPDGSHVGPMNLAIRVYSLPIDVDLSESAGVLSSRCRCRVSSNIFLALHYPVGVNGFNLFYLL